MPLEKHYPLVLQFLGAPWDADVYTWEEPTWEHGIRQDSIRLTWTKCRIEVSRRLTGKIAHAYNGEMVNKYGEPTQLRVTLFTES